MQCGARLQHWKRLHINDLKEWRTQPGVEMECLEQDLSTLHDGHLLWTMTTGSPGLPALNLGLDPEQQAQVHQILTQVPNVFTTTPGCTHLATHHIPTWLGKFLIHHWAGRNHQVANYLSHLHEDAPAESQRPTNCQWELGLKAGDTYWEWEHVNPTEAL
ncbi:UNVERIFIED_CONTAM: hypothetical protein K2H54_039208 [Gekko kuhli]